MSWHCYWRRAWSWTDQWQMTTSSTLLERTNTNWLLYWNGPIVVQLTNRNRHIPKRWRKLTNRSRRITPSTIAKLTNNSKPKACDFLKMMKRKLTCVIIDNSWPIVIVYYQNTCPFVIGRYETLGWNSRIGNSQLSSAEILTNSSAHSILSQLKLTNGKLEYRCLFGRSSCLP